MRDQRTTLMRTPRQRSMTSEGVGSASSGFLQGLQLLTPSSVYFGRHSHAPAVPERHRGICLRTFILWCRIRLLPELEKMNVCPVAIYERFNGEKQGCPVLTSNITSNITLSSVALKWEWLRLFLMQNNADGIISDNFRVFVANHRETNAKKGSKMREHKTKLFILMARQMTK